jgi:hypothetical protein
MTVEADIKTALSLECDRVFPDFAPVMTARPYVTYQQIGGEALNYRGNEVPDLQNGDFQINVWAASRPAAMSLIRAIETRLRAAAAFTAQPLSAPVSDFDADVPVYGARQDWTIWSTR